MGRDKRGIYCSSCSKIDPLCIEMGVIQLVKTKNSHNYAFLISKECDSHDVLLNAA